jgi:transposase
VKDSKLKRFFLRIQKKKGSKIAAVALARKVLCILFHLLINQEIYQEDISKRNKSIKIDKTQPSSEISLKEMIDCIVRAGYAVEKKLTKGADTGSRG